MTENELGKAVIGAAMKVHSALGPGLLESAYELCLAHEIERRGLIVGRQVSIPVFRLGGFKLGYLFNFNVAHMRDGIARIVNGL
jgi:PD-(D/E)XK nuclease superfamily